MKRLVAAIFGSAALIAALAAPVSAVDTHLHCVTTPSGDVIALAEGVTLAAPHDTLHQFHAHVHEAVLLAGTTPLVVSADFTEPFTCPPSP